MARYAGSLPPVVMPVDRVTLHEWRQLGLGDPLAGRVSMTPDDLVDVLAEAAAQRQRGEFGPAVDAVDVDEGTVGTVTFPLIHTDVREVFVVAWHDGVPMYWTAPLWTEPGNSVSFGPLPVAGEIVDAG